MGLAVGADTVDDVELGASQVDAWMHGADQVWPSGPRPFSPDDVTGLSLWLDASDASTIDLTGSSVDEWRDKSPNGLVFDTVKGTAPTRNVTVNSLDAIDFNDTGSIETTVAGRWWGDTYADQTFFIVLHTPDTSDNAAILAATATGWRISQYLSYIRMTGLGGNSFEPITNPGLIPAEAAFIAHGFFWPNESNPESSSDSYEVAVDGNALGASVSPLTNTAGTSVISLGADPSQTNAWKGYICEVVCYDRYLDATERAQVLDYLAVKWIGPPTVAEENALTGDSEPSLTGAGNLAFQGFAREMSVNAGDTIDFAIDGVATSVDIYRVGHYGGTGWRKVTTIVNNATEQPASASIPDSAGGTECSGWTTTASWWIPSLALSGLYIAVPLNATAPASWIPFVVRNDSRQADIVAVLSTSTWGLAYNYYGTPGAETGGRNLYGLGAGVGNINDRCIRVSADRPIISRIDVVNHWDSYESAGIDYLEEQGFDVKYVASHDLEADPTRFNDAKVYISMGHDEYWSQGMRDAVEAFRDAGGHLLFLSANEVFWRVRWENNFRTMVCYKDTMGGAVTPDPVTWTGTWRDTRWPNREPEALLTGTTFRMNGIQYLTADIAAATFGGSPFWRDTTMETPGTDLVIQAIGFEADSMDLYDGRPQAVLAETILNIDGKYANDDGQFYNGNGDLDWGIIMHQINPTDGYVVSFASMAWLWTLSNRHDFGADIASDVSRQAMLNLLYDFGATADTVDVGLTTPTPVALSTYNLQVPADSGGIWAGPDPTEITDTQQYELSTVFLVGAGGAEITGCRIWNPGNDTVTGRVLRLWLDATATLVNDSTFPYDIPDQLQPGWNEFTFPAPYTLAANTYYALSIQVGGQGVNGYGATPFVSYADGNITLTGGYYFGAWANYPNQGGSSFYGIDPMVAGGTPTPTVPDAPTSVAANPGDGQVTINWTDETSGVPAPTYTIERKTGAGAYGALVSGIAAGTQTYVDSSAVNDTAYTYRVRATNSEGDSAWVETAEVTPTAGAASATYAWSGATPTEAVDLTQYTLATEFAVAAATTITHVRIWNPGLASVTSRTLYLWADSVVVHSQTLPSQLTAGWNEVALSTPYAASNGVSYMIGLDVGDGADNDYGAVTSGLDPDVTDGVITLTQGRWVSGHDTLPVNTSTAFYGIEPGYQA